MLTTLITFYALNANISYPSEEYEIGSGQNDKEYYPITEEPSTIPENDIYFLDENFTGKVKKSKKTKKSKKNKGPLYVSAAYESQNGEVSSTNIVIASLGGVMVVTGMVLVVRNYCHNRGGYEMIQPNLGVGYGSMDNIYNGE